MTDKLQTLYDGLKDSYNLGSIDEFRTKMEDETKRRTFYDAVSPHYNLGDYDSFNSKLGYGNGNVVENAEEANQRMVDAVTPTPEPTPTPAPAPEPALAMKADDTYLTDEDRQEIADTAKMSWREANKLGKQAYGIAGQRPTADSSRQASEFINANRENATQYEETEKRNQERKIEEAKPIAQAYDEVAESMRENAKAMREADKQLERDYYALTKAASDYATEKYGPMPKSFKDENDPWLNAYKDYLKSNDPNNVYDQYNNYFERNRRRDNANFIEHMAKQTERRAKQTIRQAERGAVGNVVGGIGYGLGQPSSWTMGMSDLFDAMNVLTLANKLKNGEKLSEHEQQALDAYGTYEEAANVLREYDTRGFKAGETTGEMLPFMAQMALNPAGGMGESMAKEGVRKAVAKTAGDAVADVALKEYGTMATKDLLKRYGVDGMMARLPIAVRRVGGDLAASAVLANTLQAGSTFNDVVQRKYGAPVQDGEHYTFDPQQEKSWAEAAYKGELSSIIENFTEMMGEWKVLGLADKMSNFGSKQVSRIVRALGDSDFAKGLGEVLKDAHWSGIIGETLEEEYGILLNSLLTGDNKFSDLWDLDQQIDIMLGVGLFGGLMGGAKMAAYPAEYVNRKNHLEDVTAACREWKGPEWDQIQERIDNADNEGLRAIVASAIAQGGEEQRNILLYIDALQRMRGITIARDLLPGDEDTKTMQEFYLNGYDGADKKAIQSAFEHKRGQLQQIGGNALLIADTDGLYATDEKGQQIFQGEMREMVRDYLNAKAAYYGMNDGIDDRAQRRAKAAELMVRSNDNNGRQVEATLRNGEKVHIISGEVGMTDNAPDMAHSSASIVIRREDGSKEMISPALIKSIDNVQNTEEVATLAAQRAEEESRNEDLAELEQSDPIVDLQAMADIENAENSGKAGATYVKDAVVTLPDGTTGIINMTPDQTDDHMVEVVWSNPNGRPTVEHISAQDLYDLEHPAVTASEIAQDEQVQNTEDEVRLSAEEQAYNDWTAKHGENSLNKLNQTRAYAEEKLSEQESQLAEVNQELADLPDIQDEEIVKKQTDLEKRKAELEQSIANYQAVLGQMNSIQSVYDAQNGVAEQPTTAEEKVVPVQDDGTGVRFSLTPEEQKRMDILLKRQKRRKLTAKEQTELEGLTNQMYDDIITDEVRQAAKERVEELNKASMERMLTDEERNEYLRMTDLAYDAHTAPGKLGEAIKRLQTITAEIVALEDKAEKGELTDDEKKTLNRLQRDYLMAEQAFVTDADIEDAQKLMDEYQKSTGVKMRLISDITKASEDDIEKALKGGRSWITGDNEVVFVLPKIKHTGTDLGRMYRHEVLSHYNLKNSMSKEDWNQFLDEVWAVMPEDQRERLDKTYAQHYKKGHTDEEYHRLLADEFIATNAEKLFTKASEYRTIGQKIIDAITNWIRGDKKTDTPMDTPILPEFIEKKLRDVYGKKIDKQSDSKSEGTRNSIAYHGSGADFDKFDHSFMSTGEGSQVYGWGTYVSTNPETSKVYANISGIETVTYEGEKAPTYYGRELADMMAQSMWQNNKTFEQAKQETLDALNSFAEKDNGRSYDKEIEFISGLKESDFVRHNAAGRMLYTVDIPDDNGENYLHWDKPITDSQSDKIVNALLAMPEVIDEYGEDAEREVKSSLGHGTYGKNIEGALNYFLGDEKNYATDEDPGAERNSKFLNSLGFVGMQVAVDRRGGKRYDGDNYVIYNPDDIQIKDKTRFSIQDEETNDVFNRAIEEYGTTEDSNLAGYMLPDGRYLDFSEGSGMRTLDHRNVGMAYEGTVDEKYEYMNDFMKRGAIRIMPEGGGFELAVAPTFEQKRTLRQFIAERDGDVFVDFLNPDGGNPISAEYYEAEPSRVLADIDRYFNEGVKPISDVRYSIIDEANAKQKQPGEDIDATDVDVRYSLSKNNRQAITAWLNKNKNLTDDEKRNVMGFIDNLDDTTLQLATGRWYGKGVIRLPEDMDKVEQAVEVARRAKVDPLQYDNPMELINQHADIKIKEKPIDPNTVSTLHKAQEFPEQGIVIYDVDESEESRENMRKIINTHFGEQASPWCLLAGDGEGNLTEGSKNWWNHYDAYPKQVAFKDGKLTAFSANDKKERVWWDRQDKSHKGIPAADKVYEDGRRQAQMYEPGKGLVPYGVIFRGNKQNGLYEEWFEDGQLKDRSHYKDGFKNGLSEEWYPDGTLYQRGTLKDGRYNGFYESWYPNGNRYIRANYTNGSRDGLFEEWYENGLMFDRANYTDRRYNGIREKWYQNGQMSRRIYYEMGEEQSVENWDIHGNMYRRLIYRDGKRIELPLTDDKGEPAPGQDVEREEIPRFSIAEESPIRYSLVVDPELYDQLESGEKEKGYRNVTLNEDGTLGSPMAGRLGRANVGSVATSSFELGNWEQSEENPDMADESGKINLIKPDDKGEVRGVNYNPYIHIRPTAVNKQFTQAWNRPELVYIETEYPTSELTSGYKAEKANLPVGRHKWSNGDLILSRYDKPMRIVPWEEVADQWVKEFKKSGVTFDIVPPALLPILAERGVTILPPKKAAQQPAMEAYNQWKAEQTGMPDYITDERDGEMISEETPDNTTRFSLSTWENGGREDFIAFLDKQIAAGVLPEDARETFISKMDETYKQAKKIYDSGDFETFNEWSDLEVARDSAGNSIYTVIKPNNEYGMNLDFSLVCKKRRTLNAVLNEMIDRDLIKYLGSADGDLSIARINELIRNYGFETACRLCFVDAKRFRQVKVADDFVQLYNGLVNKLIPRGSKIKATFFDFARTGRYTDTEQPLNQQADDQLNISALQKIVNTEDKKKGDEPGRTVTYKIAKHLLENPQDRQYVQREDFMSTRGFGNVKAENRAVLGLYNAKKGSGGPKVTEGDVQYLGDVAKAGWSPEEAFKVGGVRIQSFSDYVPHMVFDYIQMVADLAAGKFPAHAYTKEELFAKMFGRTGIKINLSLVPAVVEDGVAPGLDKDGNYVWQENETFPFDEAIAVQNAEGYRENCGTIAVGVSDEQILKMLADEDIRMVIPYHKSGLNKKIAVYNNIDKFTDYTKSQNTRYKDGKKLSKSDAADEPNFNELLQREGDPNAAAQAYLDWCTYHDYLPKFDQFAYDDKGNMRQGYYKLLEDFTTYVPNAEGGHDFYPQRAITLTLPEEGDAFGSSTEIMRRGLQEDEELTRRQEEMVKPIVDEIQQMLTGEKPQTRYSIIGEVGASRDHTEEGLTRLENLNVAREMEEQLKPDWNAKDDENALKIKMATGWERGGDGKWRYEIPDAQFKNGALDKRWGGKTTLGDIVDAPELFAMYPSLKDIKVKRETKRGLDGRYVQGENTMYISTGDYNAYQKRIQMAEEAGYSNYDYLTRNVQRALNQIYSTLTHELQHSIQAQEGFARGGSSSMLRPDYNPTELNRKIEEFNRQVDQWNNMSREERHNAHDFSRAIDRLGREIQRERAANVLGLQGYRRLAGETEARNASTRREMTAEQKRNSLLASTEDVARPDQIYIYRAIKEALSEDDTRYSVSDNTNLRDPLSDVVPTISQKVTQEEIDKAMNSRLVQSWLKNKDNGANLFGAQPIIIRELAKASLGIDNKFDVQDVFYGAAEEIEATLDYAREKGASVADKYDMRSGSDFVERLTEEGSKAFDDADLEEIAKYIPEDMMDDFRDALRAYDEDIEIRREEENIRNYDNGNALTKAFTLYALAMNRLNDLKDKDERLFNQRRMIRKADGTSYVPANSASQPKEGETEYYKPVLKRGVEKEIIRRIATMPISRDVVADAERYGLSLYDDTRYSITPEMDADYRKAYEDGDVKKAEQMVKDAFIAKYPNTKVVDENGEPLTMYHGTTTAGFNVFKPREGSDTMGWFTTSKRDADSYAGNAEGKLYDSREKASNEMLTAGLFPLGKHFVFDSQEELDDFVKRFPNASDYMTEREIDDALFNVESDEEDARLESLRDEFDAMDRAYSRYEREHMVDTTIGELLDNPDVYSAEDFERAMYAFDSNAYLDEVEEMEPEDEKRELINTFRQIAEENEDDGDIRNIRFKSRVPRGGSAVKADDTNRRTYATYLNITNPLFIDAKGKHSELESGDIYNGIWMGLDDNRYDGIIIKNWRVGRYQDLGTVAIPKSASQIKLANTFTFDDNGELIPLSERFNDENNDIRYSFVGEQAASNLKAYSHEWIMMSDLNDAKAMERLGRSKEWIKSTTGWERGADGKWRYEMEDLELNDDFFEAQTIGDAVKESRLLTAYPELNDAKVLFKYVNPVEGSWFNSEKKEFYIEYSSPAYAAKALAHEIQHYIQEREGFAEGTSPEFFDEGKDLDYLNEVFSIDDDSSLKNLLDNIDDSKKDTPKFRAYNSVYALVASGYPVKDAKAKLISDMGQDPDSFFGKYKRTAGEVEARNVQRRMNMSLADRLASLASATEDVAREDQIIILNGAVQEYKEENEPIMAPLSDLTDTRYSISLEPSNVRSEYNDGDIVVYNPRDIADIQAAVMREAYTHKDIRNLNGWDGFMDAAYRMGSNDIVSRAMRNGFNFGEATEQWIFENAERMVAPFEKMMSENNIDLRYSVSGDEIRMYLIKREGLLDDIDLMVMREDLPVEPSVRFSTTGSPSARDLYDASQQSTLNNLYRAYIDYSKPLRDFQAIIAEESGKPIEDFENAWEAENQRSSKSKAEIEKYEITYFEPMRDAVKELQESAGITYEEVLRYLIAKHGLERNVVLAMRDAEAQYKKYQQEHPTGTKTVDDFFNENRKRDYSGLTTLSGKDDVAEAEDYARDLVNAIESGALFETSELWKAISDAVKAIQKKRYNSGLISKSQMEHEADMFNNYIPLRGFAETIAEDVYDYYEDTQRNRPQRDRKAKGRTSLADDPLATIGAMAASAITLGNKNLVKQRFLNMVENHPTNLATVKDVWVVNVGTPTDPVWAPEYPNIHEGMTADEIDQELKDYDLRMDALQNMGMAKKATNKLDIKWRTLGQQAQQHIITIRRGGKEQMVIINGNPQVARTVNGVNNPDAQLSDFMRGVRAVQRFMAANFTTRNPAFVVSNLLRDVGFAVMATAAKEDTAYKRRFMRNISHSLVTITNMGKLIRKWQNGTLDDSNEIERYFGEFMDFGGETGYTAENTVDAYRKKMIQGLKSKNALQRGGETVLDFFELCNRSVEDMTRFTTYLTSRQMGRSVQRSVADAKNITVNFNRKGSGEMCQKYVASAFLFLNAGIQSLQNIAKISGVEFGLDADGKKIKINVNGKKLGKSVAILFGSQVLAGMLIPMLNEMMMGMLGGDDDDEPVTDEEGVVIETNPYRRLTEFERRNNICLWLGGDNFIKIPIAIELRAFYGLGETMYGMMAGMPNPNPGADVVDQMLDLLPVNFIESGGLVPDAVAPLWESFISNKNYQGVPLYNDSEFLENAPEASKVYSNTGDAYIAISRFINELGGGDEVSKSKLDTRLTNPAIMQHIVEGYLGGLLTTSRQTAKLIGQPIKQFVLGQEVEPIPAREWPVVNRLYINTDKRNDDRYVKDRYYFYRDQAEKMRHDERGYLERLDDPKYEKKYNELIESPEYMDYIAFGALNQAVKDAHNVVKELGSEYKEFEIDAMRNLVNALDEESNGIINPQGWGESIRGKDKNNAE